jgi:hypothetical protein
MGVTIIYQSLLKIGIGLPTGTPILRPLFTTDEIKFLKLQPRSNQGV